MTEYVVRIIGGAGRWWTSMRLEEREDGCVSLNRSSPTEVVPMVSM